MILAFSRILCSGSSPCLNNSLHALSNPYFTSIYYIRPIHHIKEGNRRGVYTNQFFILFHFFYIPIPQITPLFPFCMGEFIQADVHSSAPNAMASRAPSSLGLCITNQCPKLSVLSFVITTFTSVWASIFCLVKGVRRGISQAILSRKSTMVFKRYVIK